MACGCSILAMGCSTGVLEPLEEGRIGRTVQVSDVGNLDQFLFAKFAKVRNQTTLCAKADWLDRKSVPGLIVADFHPVTDFAQSRKPSLASLVGVV